MRPSGRAHTCVPVSVPGRTPTGTSLCHAAQRCPGAMASGSEPSPSPSLGCMRQPCLLLPAQPQPGGRCDRSWSPGGQQDRVGTPTALAVPAAAPWDQDDTVELGTGKGTLTHPIPGHLVWPREPCVCTAPGSLQPAELSSDTHACTHTCAHTDTCTHTYVYTHTGTQTCMRTHTHTHTHTGAVLCFPRQDNTQAHTSVHPQPRPCACPACVCARGHVWSWCTQRMHTRGPAHPHRACEHSCSCHLHTHTLHTEPGTLRGAFAHVESVQTTTHEDRGSALTRLCT